MNNPPNYRAVLKQLGQLRKRIETAPPAVWKKAFRFFESVDTAAAEMEETLRDSRRATDKQQEAVNNWLAAVERWFK